MYEPPSPARATRLPTRSAAAKAPSLLNRTLDMIEPRVGTQRNARIVVVEQVGHGGGSKRCFNALRRVIQFAMQWAQASAVRRDSQWACVNPPNRIHRLDDIQDANLRCRPGSFAAPIPAALRHDQAGLDQGIQDFRHVVDRHLGTRRNVLCGTF